MSWYVAHDGRQVWVEARERVFTCDKPEDDLPKKTLTYLASNLQKSMFAEHAIDEDEKKGKKKDKQAGRQRGFIVRVDKDERGTGNVHPAFQAAVERLMSSGLVSRVDVDEPEGGKKRNKKAKDVEEVREEEAAPGLPLGVNECRVETIARCHHQAHGVGFDVMVSEERGTQRIHMFTASKELGVEAWHGALMQALAAAGTQVLMGRLSPAIAPDPPVQKDKSKEAAKEEDEWLDSLMGRCMVSKEPSAPDEEGKGGYKAAEAEAKKAPVQAPPWLRGRVRAAPSDA
ncbi:unnamed protein product [Effrenium voratum]|nr:unnamed protein product [Effrenium voratum]